VKALRTIAAPYLLFEHTGPYDDLPAFYERILGMQMTFTGMALAAAPIIEVYRNSPAEVAAEDLKCDIYVPVVKPA
jgi:predicted transcriptional regulator YdeE